METESEYDARRTAGETGGERIQTALDRAAGDDGGALVTVTGRGPDDGAWETEGLEIGDETTLLIRNATIKLADCAGNNVLRNRDLEGGNDGISVVGVGDATVDGNAPNQPREVANHGIDDKRPEWIGLRFEHCDDLTVRGLRIERTTAWGVKGEAARDFEAANLRFEQDDAYINQDGVHVCGPAERVTIRNLTGKTWDDAAVLNVGGATDAYGPLHGGGRIKHASIRHVRVAGHRPVRAFTERGRPLRNVTIADIDTWGPVTNNTVELNATYATAVPDPGDVRDIEIRDVRGQGCDQVVDVDSPATGLRIEGVTARDVRDAAIRFRRPVGDVTVRGVEHRSDATALPEPGGEGNPRGTATLRWTDGATAGDIVVRDVVAREVGPTENRQNTVADVQTPGTDLVLTIDGVEMRGTRRTFALGDVQAAVRNVRTRDVVE